MVWGADRARSTSSCRSAAAPAAAPARQCRARGLRAAAYPPPLHRSPRHRRAGSPRAGPRKGAPPSRPPRRDPLVAHHPMPPRPRTRAAWRGTSPGEGQRPSPMGSAGFRTPEFAGASPWAGGSGGGEAGRMPVSRPRGGRAAAPAREAQGRCMEGGARTDAWKCSEDSMMEKQSFGACSAKSGPGLALSWQAGVVPIWRPTELVIKMTLSLCMSLCRERRR